MGYCESTNYQIGSGAPLVDKMLGNAFMLVKLVADNIATVKYIAFNMQALISLAEQAANEQSTITALQAVLPELQTTTAAVTAIETLMTSGQAAALLNLAVPSFPVYSGTGAAPVAVNHIYIDTNGNLKVAG